LIEYARKNVSKNPNDFVTLEKYEPSKITTPYDENIHGKWQRIPSYTRNYIFNKTGANKLTVPKNMVSLIVGEPEVTASNFKVGGFDMRNHRKMQKAILAIEDYTKEVLSYAKETIAIRLGGVVLANNISNMFQVWVHTGINPFEYIKRAQQKWNELDEFRELQHKLNNLNVAYNAANDNKKRLIYQQQQSIINQLNKNSFNDLVKDGQFSPIIEDINIEEEPNKHIAKLIKKAFDDYKLLKRVKPIKEILFMDRNTAMYKGMLKITQYGDIIAREIIREEKVNRAIAEGKPLTKQEYQNLLNSLDQLFVNYAYIQNKYLRYMDRVMAVFFTKYFFRQAKAVYNTLLQYPARMGTQIGLEELSGINFQTTDDSYFNFFDIMMKKFSNNPIDVVSDLSEPTLFRWVPSWNDVARIE